MAEPENWNEFIRDLNEVAWQSELQTATGTLYGAPQPYVFEYGKFDWYFEEPPDGIWKSDLITFQWDSGPGISWEGFVQVVEVDAGESYISYYIEITEDDPVVFLAKIRPRDASLLYQDIVARIIGGDFDGEPWQRLPDMIFNGRPDLIDAATVKKGLRVQLSQVSQLLDAWRALAQRLNMTAVGETDMSLSEADKDALIDAYLRQCYTEQAY